MPTLNKLETAIYNYGGTAEGQLLMSAAYELGFTDWDGFKERFNTIVDYIDEHEITMGTDINGDPVALNYPTGQRPIVNRPSYA